MKTSTEFLQEAIRNQSQRASIRDTESERSMARTVQIFNLLYGTSLTETQGWDFMSLLKKVRSTQGAYHEDDYLDDVSYASLKAEAASREANQKTQHPPMDDMKNWLIAGGHMTPQSRDWFTDAWVRAAYKRHGGRV